MEIKLNNIEINKNIPKRTLKLKLPKKENYLSLEDTMYKEVMINLYGVIDKYLITSIETNFEFNGRELVITLKSLGM